MRSLKANLKMYRLCITPVFPMITFYFKLDLSNTSNFLLLKDAYFSFWLTCFSFKAGVGRCKLCACVIQNP